MHQPVLAKTFITFAGLILPIGETALIDKLHQLPVTGFVNEPKTKNMNRLILLLITILAVACSSDNQPEGKGEKSLEEIKSDGPIRNADIIRNPVSADTPIDTVNVAKIAFEEESYDFGEVDEGAVVVHTFSFTNTGKAPLLISSARSTCGCTVPDWPKEPVPPGEKGKIEVKFNTQGKKNRQTKPITIVANTYPATSKIFVQGFVQPAEGAPEKPVQ